MASLGSILVCPLSSSVISVNICAFLIVFRLVILFFLFLEFEQLALLIAAQLLLLTLLGELIKEFSEAQSHGCLLGLLIIS